ncbi:MULTISPECIES: spr1629 family repressor/antitoxin [Streptococcus]|uniref:XRE family transcriptional regulator n=1 Tax=Streptococcus caledonicus TaxID=2614158 RepID=A0ABW0UB35_9STRE|nr:XRE family transcriptional regulator [Streptococcus sp. S784/96/1]
MFNGHILEELRLLHGLKRSELAEKLQVSEQAIWQFENQQTTPKMKHLMALGQLFHVAIDYFDKVEQPSQFDLSRIAFRNADLETKKTIRIQTIYLEKLNQMIDYLEQFVEIPHQIIYDLCENTNHLFQEGLAIQEIAMMARKVLAIASDNSNLLYHLEKSGIYISERLINGQADAYSAWSKNGRPFIILGVGKSSVRRNFDLAHELGHLLLHQQIDFEELSVADLEEKEREANRFASYFLLPEEEFLRDFHDLVGKRVSNPDQYVLLKQKYHVSIQALEYRAYKLSLLTPQQNAYFYRQISKKGYKIVEPLDTDIPIKHPSKIRSILEVILSHNLLTLPDLTRSQKASTQYISQLFGFDDQFFDPYRETDTRFDNVIPLFSRKMG